MATRAGASTSIAMRLVYVVVLATIGCVGLQPHRGASSTAIVATDTTLGHVFATATAAHPGHSGFVLLNTGERAIAARVALADLAQSSIDAQYFEWAGDTIGRGPLDLVQEAMRRRELARSLADQRKASGLSQTVIAARMGTAASVVSKLESGADVKLSTMQRYCAALGRDLSFHMAAGSPRTKRTRTIA